MLDRLKVVGSYTGWSGYDTHTREFVRGFVRLGMKVQLINVAGWSTELPPEQREARLFDRLVTPVDADTVLHFTIPPDTRPVPALRNFNYTMFEADGIPEEWVLHAIPQRLIVVPTESSRQAWVNSGVPERKVRVSPLGVDGHFFNLPSTPLPLTDPQGRPVASYRARFLHLGEIRPRKNQLGLLRAWMKATTPRDDAILIMKLSAFQPRARSSKATSRRYWRWRTCRLRRPRPSSSSPTS
ncbi:MAG: hypothetical protein ACR2JW_08750 [Thermomicrobiales bacterium]